MKGCARVRVVSTTVLRSHCDHPDGAVVEDLIGVMVTGTFRVKSEVGVGRSVFHRVEVNRPGDTLLSQPQDLKRVGVHDGVNTVDSVEGDGEGDGDSNPENAGNGSSTNKLGCHCEVETTVVA